MTGTQQAPPIRRRHRRMAATLAVLGACALLGPLLSRATFSSSSSNTARIGSAADWAAPMVSVVDPGDGIRGTVTIFAVATDDGLGVASVSLAWAPSGTTNFVALCSDATAPYSCPFNTTALPEDEVDIRAIAIDRAGFMATDLLEGVLVDNVAPTGALGTIPSPMAGVITITATATDAGSGVASVVIERAPANTTTWSAICTDLEAPYSCRFDTTAFPTGTALDFRAVITDVAGNTAATAIQRNKLISNVIDTVSVDDPGAFLRGTVTITAIAASPVGVASVRIQRQAVGTTTWTDLCVDPATPYTCAWNTAGVADGQYNLRAILTNTAGLTTTSAVVGPVRIDNTVVRGYDVQGGAITGITGRIGTGDSISVTYTRQMQASSLLSGWTGAARAVQVRVRDGGLLGLTGSDDTLDVSTTAPSATVNLGTINLKGNYVKAKKNVVFNATMTIETVMVNGTPASKVTLTLGSLASGTVRTAGGNPTMVWTPAAAALDTTGIATSTAPVTELGPADKDV